jgi:CubicO group peptidase (beta-lactamase class C family)
MRNTLSFHSLLRRRALLAMATVLVLVVPACSEDAGPGAGEVESQIAAAVDEQLGVLSDADKVRAIVAARDGEVVYQRYTGMSPGDYRDVASVTKSVMSTLVGVAVADGLLTLDDTLAETLPSSAGQTKPAVAKVTVRHLLTMTGGFPEAFTSAGNSLFESRDWVAAGLAAGTGATETLVYSDAGVHLLTAMLVEATGMSVLDYARKELFDPLGIDTRPALVETMGETMADPTEYETADFAWPTDPQGIHFGASWMKLRPQDMLKLGQLYLDGGIWQASASCQPLGCRKRPRGTSARLGCPPSTSPTTGTCGGSARWTRNEASQPSVVVDSACWSSLIGDWWW